MATSLSRSRDELVDELQTQVTALKRELATLRREANKRGAAAYEEAGDFASNLYGRLASSSADASKEIVRGAKVVDRTVRDHPVPTAVIGLALFAAAAMMLSRR